MTIVAAEILKQLRDEVGRVVVGQPALIDGLLTGLLAGGHVLVEGVPGLAKTTAVRCLAEALGLGFRRVQFTPDLLPGDLIGTPIYVPEERRFDVHRGPIFAPILLADIEIRGAAGRTHRPSTETLQLAEQLLARGAEQASQRRNQHRRMAALGAGTSLAGGCLPIDGGVVVMLTRMKRIVEIRPAAEQGHTGGRHDSDRGHDSRSPRRKPVQCRGSSRPSRPMAVRRHSTRHGSILPAAAGSWP